MNPNPDLENLEITFPCASPAPYMRESEMGVYYECLQCNEQSVHLERLNGGASMLRNHNPDDILGTVVRAWCEDGRLMCRVRFRKNSEEAVSMFRDIVDGTVQNVSIGYMQDNVKFRRVDGRIIGDVVEWTPFEVSVAVGVPADPTVGFYRSLELKNKKRKEFAMNDEEQKKKSEEAAENEEQKKREADGEDAGTDEQEKSRRAKKSGEEPEEDGKDEEQEKKRSTAIRSIAAVFGDYSAGESAVKRGLTPEQFRTELKEHYEIKSLVKQKGFPAIMSTRKQRGYSLTEAFRYLLTGNADHGGYEREISNEMYKRAGVEQSSEGALMIPLTPFYRDEPGSGTTPAVSDPNAVTTPFGIAQGNAASLLDTEYHPEMFIDIIRNRIANIGATYLSGLKGNIRIPMQTATGSVSWVSSLNDDVKETAPAIGDITMSPKKLGGFTKVQKDVIVQGVPAPMNLAMADLLTNISMKLSCTMLKGNAADPAITGLDTATGVQTVTIANLANATWQDFLKFDALVGDMAITGTPKFIMRSASRQTLKGISKDSGSGRYICEGNMIDGAAVEIDGQIGADDIFYGDFSNILVGTWGGLEVMLDPYRWARSGQVEIIANLIADVAIRNPKTFVKRVKS